MTAPQPHPFGHGRAPSASEQARFCAIVADLAGDSPRAPRRSPAVTAASRRLQRLVTWLQAEADRR